MKTKSIIEAIDSAAFITGGVADQVEDMELRGREVFLREEHDEIENHAAQLERNVTRIYTALSLMRSREKVMAKIQEV